MGDAIIALVCLVISVGFVGVLVSYVSKGAPHPEDVFPPNA